jgi:protein-tyrosine phosphatase
VIDLHSHVLHGIDDGPDSIEGSVALARAAHAAGTTTLLATPHVSWRYDNDPGTIARLVEELNARLSEEGIELAIHPAGELAMTRLVDLDPGELSKLGYGAGRWLLVEPPFTPVVTGLEALVADLQRQGHHVLLAHPERCPAFHRDRTMLELLVSTGVLTSLTAGSLVGRFGERVRRFSLELVRDGLVHNVASDAHDHEKRPPGLRSELESAGLSPLIDWLTLEVPTAILEDREIPPRPIDERSASMLGEVRGVRRRWWQRR